MALRDCAGEAAVALGLCLIILYLFDMYNLENNFSSFACLVRFSYAMLLWAFSTASVVGVVPSWKIDTELFVIQIAFNFLLLCLWRLIFNFALVRVRHPKVVVIAGSGWTGQRICEELSKNKQYLVRGFIEDDPRKQGLVVNGYRVIGGSNLLVEMAKKKEAEAVVVATRPERRPALENSLIESTMKGLSVYDMPSFYEYLTGKLPVHHLRRSWILSHPIKGVRSTIYVKKVKRLFDIVFALVGLILSAPIALFVACAIVLDSRGPVFYRQKRVGLNGEVFEILKFRSMKVDAETNGAVWATVNDSRVTSVGRIIRKTRIDEIPQMLNVLRGEMSFIGPRPERPEFVEHLEKEIPFYNLRHSVKPGITGWAQIHYHYGASREDALEKLEYDLFYMKNLSPTLDLSILLRTFRVILFLEGSR